MFHFKKKSKKTLATKNLAPIQHKPELDKSLRDLIEIIHFTGAVSAKISGLLDEAKIFETVQKEFLNSKYTLSILLLTDQGTKLRILESSMPRHQVSRAEKMTGLQLKKYKIDLQKSDIYRQVIQRGVTLQVRTSDIIKELFSWPLAHLIIKLLHYQTDSCVITPLSRQKKIIGVLAISSTKLADYFMPSVESLAQHISNVLQLAHQDKQRCQTEKEIKKFKAVADNANYGVAMFDIAGKLIYLNEYFAKIHGYQPEEVLGHSFHRFHSEKQIVIVDQLAKKIRQQGALGAQEIWHQHKDGSLFPMLMNFCVIKDEQDKPSFIATTAIDIGELKKAEARIKEYSHQLETKIKERTKELIKANKARTEFMADISHELRSPLAIIRTNLDLLKREYPYKEEILMMEKTVNRMTELISQLIHFSQIDAGKKQFKKEDVNLNQLIEDAAHKFSSLAREKDVKINFLPAKIIKVQGDADALETMISNLISNAVRYNKRQGQIKINLSASRSRVKIEVADTGIGIPRKDLEHIFERFYRVDKSRSRDRGGQGLGLAIVKEMIEAHQGQIKVVSRPGQGSKFSIFLPR